MHRVFSRVQLAAGCDGSFFPSASFSIDKEETNNKNKKGQNLKLLHVPSRTRFF